MNDIQEGVRAYLQRVSGVHNMCAPSRHAEEYPLITVDAWGDGAVPRAGGTQTEHRYCVTVTAANDHKWSDKNRNFPNWRAFCCAAFL